MFGKFIPCGRLKAHFAKRIRRTLLHSQTPQEILERLDLSYRRFFKRLSRRSPKFRKAHRANDAVVIAAYGFRKDMAEPEIVAELFKMYVKLVSGES